MPLTRLDNLYSSKTGKYLYVSPDDFNATDELDNRGNSPLRPFKTIQRAFIEVSRYSYLPGKDNDRFDQFSVMLMPGNHFIDNRPGLVDAATPVSRNFDAGNLIEANTKQIIDRACAEIAIQYPDFYFPGDQPVDSGTRPSDAYRLIQQNRKEIVDRATAKITVDHPDFFYPGDAANESDYRFKDAYRLIQQNRQEIIDDAWTTMNLGANPADPSDEAKCKRDIGLLIDYIGLDLVNGGNEYTRKFTLKYFDGGVFSYIISEVLSTNDAYNAARDLMIQAMRNELTITDATITTSSAGTPACDDVQSAITTLVQIVTDAFTAADTAGLPAETLGTDHTGEAKCKADTGRFVDAISLDVIQAGGNVYARKFVKNYFNQAGTAWITNGLEGEEQQSITAFNEARDQMIRALTNQLLVQDLTLTADSTTGSNRDPASCASVSTNIGTLTTIVTTSVGDGNLTNLPAEVVTDQATAGETKCKRDIGYVVEAVIADVRNGGNANTISATKTYFDRDGNPVADGLVGEITESVTSFNKARDMMKLAVTNSLYEKDLTISPGPAIAGQATPTIEYNASGNIATCVDIQTSITTLVAILTDTVTAGTLTGLAAVQVTGTVPVFDYNRALEEWQMIRFLICRTQITFSTSLTPRLVALSFPEVVR